MSCGYYLINTTIGNTTFSHLQYKCMSDYHPYVPDVMFLYIFAAMVVIGLSYLTYRFVKKNKQA